MDRETSNEEVIRFANVDLPDWLLGRVVLLVLVDKGPLTPSLVVCQSHHQLRQTPSARFSSAGRLTIVPDTLRGRTKVRLLSEEPIT